MCRQPSFRVKDQLPSSLRSFAFHLSPACLSASIAASSSPQSPSGLRVLILWDGFCVELSEVRKRSHLLGCGKKRAMGGASSVNFFCVQILARPLLRGFIIIPLTLQPSSYHVRHSSYSYLCIPSHECTLEIQWRAKFGLKVSPAFLLRHDFVVWISTLGVLLTGALASESPFFRVLQLLICY